MVLSAFNLILEVAMYTTLPLDESHHLHLLLPSPLITFLPSYILITSTSYSMCSIPQEWHRRFTNTLAPLREINRFPIKEGLSHYFALTTFRSCAKFISKLCCHAVTPDSEARAPARPQEIQPTHHPLRLDPNPAFTLSSAFLSLSYELSIILALAYSHLYA